METSYFAQAYDISAEGFFFRTGAEYQRKVKAARNRYGQPVEEFEIQFIDGEDIDAALFNALGIHQATILRFLEKLDEWQEDEKLRLIVAVGECGYSFDIDRDEPDEFEVDLYPDMTLTDLAHQFVDDGLFGEVSDRVLMYLDYDLIARDLGFDYSETTIAGAQYIYRAA